MKNLFANKNFLFHWLSSAVFFTGSHFTLVALPWLVLGQFQENAVLLSLVLGVFHIPQGIFILFGGGVVDRLTPYRTLLISRSIAGLIVFLFSFLVFIGFINLYSLLLFAFVVGALTAIGIPASQSILPQIVKSEQLGMANGIVISTAYCSQIVGPAVAGALIWLGGKNGTGFSGVATAFVVDALAIALSVVLLLRISVKKDIAKHVDPIGAFILSGLKHCWRDEGVRRVLLYIALISLFIHGPLIAGLPIFAKSYLELNGAGFGSLYSMIGFGTILGAVLAVKFNPSPAKLGIVVLICDFFVGLYFSLLGNSTSIISSSIFLVGIGLSGGIVMTAGTTWFQQRTPPEYMGRVMSILMFTVMGLIPVSVAFTGYIVKLASVVDLMLISGLIVMVITIISLCFPGMRNMGAAKA